MSNGIIQVTKSLGGKHRVRDVFGMRQLANRVASTLSTGEVLLLTGEVGSGKTTFVQCLATVLGVSGAVTSPTYTIAAEYDLPTCHIAGQLIHVDLYRLEKVEGQDLMHIRDLLRTAKKLRRIIAIEWPERLGRRIPRAALKIHFEHGEKEGERFVTIKKGSKRLT